MQKHTARLAALEAQVQGVPELARVVAEQAETIRRMHDDLREEILQSAREYQARIDASESSRALLVKQIRKLAQNSVVRPYANQLLSTLGEPCVAEEDVREKLLERLLEDISRLASQPSRGLI
jgi:uncharacterized coiled-coil protein SlyX